MTTPRRTLRRPLAPLAAPREPVHPARIGRRVVRRRAKGMDEGAVAQALEDARFDARQDSRHEHLVDDERSRAELAADAAAAAAWEAEQREAARVAARADELQALRELGTLEQTEPREGDEAARDELTRRADSYVQKDVDAWLAHALAKHLGHCRDPAAREAAADLLPTHLLAHAALLTELAHLAPGTGVDQLAFAARLAAADPEATATSPRSSPAPGPSRADLTLRNAPALPDPIGLTAAADID